jgi:hypothetical protein
MIEISIGDLPFIYSHPACRISLGIAVDQERLFFGDSQTGGQVNRRRRLANTPLLIRDADGFAHDGFEFSYSGSTLKVGGTHNTNQGFF